MIDTAWLKRRVRECYESEGRDECCLALLNALEPVEVVEVVTVEAVAVQAA